MNVLHRLTIRNLLLNKKRTIVTLIGIILSGAMICGVASLVASFQDLMLQAARSTDGNYHATFYEVHYQDSRYITDHAYTESAMFTRDRGFSRLENPQNDMKPYLFLKAYDSQAFEHMPVTLKKGRFPSKDGELVVSEQLAADAEGYRVGQQITMVLGSRVDEGVRLSQAQPMSETETFEPYETETFVITGIIARPRYESSASPAFTAICYLDENTLSPMDRLNISILAARPRSLYEKIPQMAESIGVERVSYNDEILKWMGISRNANYVNMLTSVGLVLISLIVVGSVTVIYNAFSISVSERKKQFGMLSSVGATARQIRRSVFFEGFILALIGIPLGVISGIFGIGVTIKVINPLMQNSLMKDMDWALRLVVSPSVVVTTVLFVTLVVFLSAYIPANRASRISPIEAIRLNTDIRITGKKLKTSKLARRLFGIEGEIALKNLKRNRRRYRATVFSLFISIVLFVSISTFTTYGFKSSMMYYGEIPYDITVNTRYDIPIETKLAFFDRVKNLDDVERFLIPRSVYTLGYTNDLGADKFSAYIQRRFKDLNIVEIDSDNYVVGFSIYTIGQQAFDAYVKENGLQPSDFNETDNIKAIFVNKDKITHTKIVEYVPTTLKEGDVITVQELPSGELTPSEITLEIAAVTDTFPFGIEYNGALCLFISEESFQTMLSGLHEDSQREALNTEMRIETKEPAKLKTSIQSLHDQYYNGTIYIANVQETLAEMRQTLLVISIFLYGFLTLITLIGVTNIFNTISTNIALRRREFAMLKSVGLTPRGMNRMINYESIFYGVKALLYGLPVSIVISVLLYNSFDNLFSFQFMLPLKEIIICIAGVFVIVYMTMMHAGSRLKKDNIVDTLKEENI